MKILQNSDLRIIFLLCVICSAFNLTKAVHMDDTAYLLIAQSIIENPLHPMSGEINWEGTVEPIHKTNQPILLSYLYASVILIFGPSEIALHIIFAIITSTAIVFFYLIAKELGSKYALLLTAIFSLGPAFLPAQNLMTDVPTIALWLITFWALITSGSDKSYLSFIIAMVATAAACLIKYPSLILLPIYVVTIFLQGRWLGLWFLLIPLGALFSWSSFNLFDYGGIHILERDLRPFAGLFVGVNLIEWVIGLGAVTPFSVMFIFRKRIVLWAILAGILAGLLLLIKNSGLVIFPNTLIYWVVFFANGVFIIELIIGTLVYSFSNNDPSRETKMVNNIILLLWFLGASTFIILFSPFLAVRHILLAIPAVILILGYNLENFINPKLAILGLIFTVTLGIFLATSDYIYANLYRYHSTRIMNYLPEDSGIWYSGHWGWQWYAENTGMDQIDIERVAFQEGDYLIVPLTSDPKMIPIEMYQLLHKVDSISVPANPFVWFRTMVGYPGGGYYYYSLARDIPPWQITDADLERFNIYIVEESE